MCRNRKTEILFGMGRRHCVNHPMDISVIVCVNIHWVTIAGQGENGYQHFSFSHNVSKGFYFLGCGKVLTTTLFTFIYFWQLLFNFGSGCLLLAVVVYFLAVTVYFRGLLFSGGSKPER